MLSIIFVNGERGMCMKLTRSVAVAAAGFVLAGMITGTETIGVFAAENTTQDHAVEIALADAGLSADDVTIDDVEKGTEQNASVYEIEFHTDTREYEYDVAFADGEIVSMSWELLDPDVSGKQITQGKAKSIALDYAGVSENKATFTKAKSGTDNGIPVYEFKFTDDDAEYKCDIAKEGGEILNYSRTVLNPASVGAAAKTAAE